MTTLTNQRQIEETKDSLESLKSFLVQKYLTEHCSLIEENLDGYDGCTITRKVWRDQDYDEATEEANKVIKEALKQLNY